jgi:hypothetical protein
MAGNRSVVILLIGLLAANVVLVCLALYLFKPSRELTSNEAAVDQFIREKFPQGKTVAYLEWGPHSRKGDVEIIRVKGSTRLGRAPRHVFDVLFTVWKGKVMSLKANSRGSKWRDDGPEKTKKAS